MDVLASETCWALNKVIIKQVASSWSLFTQLAAYSFLTQDTKYNSVYFVPVFISIASAVGYSFRKSLEHSPSWEVNSSSASINIPRILWNPCSQEPVTYPCLVPDPFQTVCPGPRLSAPLRFRDILSFYDEEILAPRWKTAFVGCSRRLIQYILTYPSHLEAIPFICLPEDMPCLGENSRLQFENAAVS